MFAQLGFCPQADAHMENLTGREHLQLCVLNAVDLKYSETCARRYGRIKGIPPAELGKHAKGAA